MQVDAGILKKKKNKDIAYCCAFPNGEGPFPALMILPGFGNSFMVDEYLGKIQLHATLAGYATIVMDPSANILVDNEVDTRLVTYNNYKEDIKIVAENIQDHPNIDNEKIMVAGTSFGAHQGMQLMSENYDVFSGGIFYSLVPDLVKPFRERLTPDTERLWRMNQSVTGHGYKCVVDTKTREFNYKLYKQASKLDLFESAKAITKPVTIIMGPNDRLVTPPDILRLGDNMEQCRELSINFIKDAGHCFDLEPKPGEDVSQFDWALRLTAEVLKNFSPGANNNEMENQPEFPTLESLQKPAPVKQKKAFYNFTF